MAGKSYRLFYRPVWGPFPPSQPFLFLVCRRVSQSRFSSASPVAHPPLPLPSTSQIKLGGTFFGSQNVRVDVFLRILDHPGGPTCLSHLPVGSPPTHGSVYNHCERTMDGLRIDDVISRNREGSLTEDEVVAYVQSGDPTHQGWDDWPLNLTFRINSFLRTNGPVPDPDLAVLGFLDP